MHVSVSVAVSCSECVALILDSMRLPASVVQCVAVCCSVLQRVAVCCSVLQCVAVGLGIRARISANIAQSSFCTI